MASMESTVFRITVSFSLNCKRGAKKGKGGRRLYFM
jgi:hypothetical protein